MVRFIINNLILGYNPVYEIYIPIWLDLLLQTKVLYRPEILNLHSNMVRFIIYDELREELSYISFTFQYGQIYYFCILELFIPVFLIYIPIWLDLLLDKLLLDLVCLFDLHSNMVRFIINNNKNRLKIFQSIYIPIWLDLLWYFDKKNGQWYRLFTFQYGQIYYRIDIKSIRRTRQYLHSNMVRFIIPASCPIIVKSSDLHSNMVRFIIFTLNRSSPFHEPFTFQYGQIYYRFLLLFAMMLFAHLHSNMVRFIIACRKQSN